MRQDELIIYDNLLEVYPLIFQSMDFVHQVWFSGCDN